jgi:hypothetical protein
MSSAAQPAATTCSMSNALARPASTASNGRKPLAASPEQMRADFGNAADGAVHLFA